MIGWLQGRVLRTHATGSTLIDVNGVGYEVNLATADELRRGDDVELYIHTQVRADAIVLYGFVSPQDKEFFTTLLVTPGVGPSTARRAGFRPIPHPSAPRADVDRPFQWRFSPEGS